MKTIDEFLTFLAQQDVKLWLEGDRLCCDAPEKVLTSSLSSQLAERKQEIVTFLDRVDLATKSRQTITPVTRTENIPLSFAQQRLWFLDQMESGNPFYNLAGAVRLEGSLDIAAFEQSFKEIVRRHEVLRTIFKTIDGQAVQEIAPSLKLVFPILDWRQLAKNEQESEVLRLAEDEAQRPFDLAKGPLIRITLVKLRETEYVALLTMHHIVSDAWSMGILVRELSTLYEAFATGNPSPLPELPIQYADFAAWQRQWLQGEVLETQLSYWQKQLGDSLPVLQLPTDRPRPKVQTFRGASQSFSIAIEVAEALKALSQQEEATLFMTLLTAFNTLLYRYTLQEDLLVGSPIANRNRQETELLIGFFVNTLVLHTDLSGNPTFRELLQRVQQTAWSAYEHQDLPFEKLVEELRLERNLSYNPLFRVMFSLQNTPNEDLKFAGLTLSFIEQHNPTAKFDLILDIQETDSELIGMFEYNTDLFDGATINRMAEHFRRLLSSIVDNPEQQISELPLLTEVEQHQLIVEWNETQVEYPQNLCFHQLFEAQVEETPDAVAVVFQDEQLTYGELNQRANQLAHFLQELGVKPEVKVGICLERSLEVIIGILGILKAGGAYLPLDPTYPSERLAFMLLDSQVSVLLTAQALQKKLPKHQAQVVCIDVNGAIFAQQDKHNPNSGVTVENLAYLIYTSGSTGTPKGVLVNHQGLGNLTKDKIRTCKVQPDSRILQFFSLSFDASIPEIVMALGSGAALHLGTPEDLLPGLPLMQFLRQQAITHITLPPSALAVLPTEELPALQMVLVGGEAPSPELITQWSQGRLFINAYGPTETTVNASMVECGNDGQTQPTVRPSANKQLFILDRNLQLVPIGVPGELHIAGVGLARGYLNHPAKTAETFIPNPFSHEPGSRLYKTGDLACYLSDGQIKLLGRLDHQVKIRGFRIEPGEIEALLNQHPEVRESLVLVREDRVGDKRLVAYVVSTPEHKLKINDLRHFIEDKLPKYMIPSAFVTLDALPLNPNGKIDRFALPEPNTTPLELDEVFVAPRTPTEKVLAEIFAQVLEVEQVGVYDNFFELGGHSLLVTKLVAQLLKKFEIEVTVIDLFEAPTVASLAQRIEKTCLAITSEGTTANLKSFERISDDDEMLALLNADAVLDSSIRPQLPTQTTAYPHFILLTGATGFVGAFLLYELLQQTSARIYCLIRANSTELAVNKLENCLKSYLLWQESFKSRIVPVIGDLSQPFLGLAESQFQELANNIDAIYHNGAWVHHAFPYSLLKNTNVLGTQEVLRLACQTRTKPVHFISATSVFSETDDSGVRIIREQDNIDDGCVPLGGYTQSKWVAEKLVTAARDRGLPVSIYRLGRISGHSQTGVFNVNDYLYRLIIGCVQLGSIPDAELIEDIIPVDYASQAIVHLSKQQTSWGKAFHLTHPQPVSTNLFFDKLRSLGYPIQQITYDRWHEQLLNIAESSPEHALYPLVSLLAGNTSSSQTSASEPAVVKFDCQNTLDGLKNSSITCPTIGDRLLDIYFSYLIEHGFLEPPPNE
jgi:myxalamid-type nonribosomal peptide synthetase MxaA